MAGDISAVAIVQGAVGYCPSEKETNMYIYGPNVSTIVFCNKKVGNNIFSCFEICFNLRDGKKTVEQNLTVTLNLLFPDLGLNNNIMVL